MKGRPRCFQFFIDFVSFHLFAFTVLFSSFSFLLYTPIAFPFRMPFGTLRSMPAGTAGKSLWWIPFRASCCYFFRNGHLINPWYYTSILTFPIPLLFAILIRCFCSNHPPIHHACRSISQIIHCVSDQLYGWRCDVFELAPAASSTGKHDMAIL